MSQETIVSARREAQLDMFDRLARKVWLTCMALGNRSLPELLGSLSLSLSLYIYIYSLSVYIYIYMSFMCFCLPLHRAGACTTS